MALPRDLCFNLARSFNKTGGGSNYVTSSKNFATATRHNLKRAVLVAALALLVASGIAYRRAPIAHAQQTPVGQTPQQVAQLRLGERLFRETRFSTTKGDLPASCNTCHLFDEDPQGLRAYTDFFNRSWVSYRSQDPRRNELRNSPTLYDVALMPRLHFDGEFVSLEDLVKGTFSGRPMGWLPGEQAQAFAQLRAVLLNDQSYAPQFKEAYNVELSALGEAETVNLVARAVADLMRTFKSQQNAPYDRFLRANQLAWPSGAANVSGKARRFLSELGTLEAKGAVKFTDGFDAATLRGMKVFFRTEGEASVGNCVACHAPPLFTDFSYHNLGIAQAEYDRVHGAGQFASLSIPSAAEARRPMVRLRETPTKGKPGEVDLGFWNFIDLKNSPLRRAGERDEQLLQRMIGTFKTPTLRHLAFSAPYMHTGDYSTLEDTLREIMRLSELARVGKVRQADDELPRIRIGEADIAPLLAFLNALNEDLKAGY
jgi:cytochrome c peroxidase